MQCAQTLDLWTDPLTDVCILKVCNGDGFGSREIYRNQAPLIWFKQSHFSAEMRTACQAVDTAQMSLELPPRSDHTSGSGSLHSKDFVPQVLKREPWEPPSPERNRFPTETDQFASSNVILWPRSVGMPSACISENSGPYPNCSVSRVVTISLVSSLQILERPNSPILLD